MALNLKRGEEAASILTAKHCTGIFAAGIEIEDLYQILWVKALEAAGDWNEKKPASLYVFPQRSRENAITGMLRSSIRDPKPYSADSLRRSEGGEAEPLDMEDKTVDVESIAAVAVALDKTGRSLKLEDREPFEPILENRTQKQMADELGRTQPNVSLRGKAIRNALNGMKEELK